MKNLKIASWIIGSFLFLSTFLYALDGYPLPIEVILRYNHIVVQGQDDFDPNNPPYICGQNYETSNAWITTWTASYIQPTPAFCESIKSNAINWANDRSQMIRLYKSYLRSSADGSLELTSGPMILRGTSFVVTNGTTNVVFEKGQEIMVDNETGLVIGILDHASPKKTKTEKDKSKKTFYDKVKAAKAASTDKQKLEALYDLFNLK